MWERLKAKKVLILCLLLAVATAAVYWQVGNFEFLHYDDKLYITENSHVQAGLSVHNLRWALTTTDVEIWQPLVWLSFIVDYELYGLNAGGYHFTNLALHVFSTVLLFLLFYGMTGAVWRAAFIAAFFGLHPVHVESVAWVAERKDALSGFFFILTILLYFRYVRKPDTKRYLLVLGSFLFGLMSKSMLVTMPVIFILLDYWPLGRLQDQYAVSSASRRPEAANNATPEPAGGEVPPQRIPPVSGRSIAMVPLWQIKEKLPFFLISLAVGVIVIMAQVGQNIVTGKAVHSFGSRLANAFVSYIQYPINILAPHDLAAFYPFNEHLPVLMIAGAVLLFVGLCVAAILAVRRYPFVFVGWSWFVIMLLPVIGIIPLGAHAMTDRYTYLSSIGISIILAWGLPVIFKTDALRKKVLMPAGAVYLAVLGFLAWGQCGYWADDFTLFKHSLDVTKNNDLMHYNMSWTYTKRGDLENAKKHLQEALKINPRVEQYYANLGLIYQRQGDKAKALYYYLEGLKRGPDNDVIHCNLGAIYEGMGRKSEAMDHYKKAMTANPRSVAPHYNYATLAMEEGRFEEAEKELRTAMNLETQNREVLCELGELLLKRGRTSEAITYLKELIRLAPDHVEGLSYLGRALEKEGKYEEALGPYRRVAQLEPDNPSAYYNMGVVYSALGDVPSAVRNLKMAVFLKPDYSEAKKALRGIQGRMRKL